MDSQAIKTSLLCKWTMKAMEPNKCNLQLMRWYRLAKFNPKRGSIWGVSLDWFIGKKHKGFLHPKFGIILSRLGKLWSKAPFSFRFVPLWNFFIPIFDGRMVLNSLITVSLVLGPMNYIKNAYNAERHTIWTTFEIVNNALSSLGMRHTPSLTSPWRMVKIGSHLPPKLLTRFGGASLKRTWMPLTALFRA